MCPVLALGAMQDLPPPVTGDRLGCPPHVTWNELSVHNGAGTLWFPTANGRLEMENPIHFQESHGPWDWSSSRVCHSILSSAVPQPGGQLPGGPCRCPLSLLSSWQAGAGSDIED